MYLFLILKDKSLEKNRKISSIIKIMFDLFIYLYKTMSEKLRIKKIYTRFINFFNFII